MSPCDVSKSESCFSKFKKIGMEKVQGHSCDVYEYKSTPLPVSGYKIWRPIDLKEVLFVKLQFYMMNALIVEAQITDIKETMVKDILFEMPKSYKKLKNITK